MFYLFAFVSILLTVCSALRLYRGYALVNLSKNENEKIQYSRTGWQKKCECMKVSSDKPGSAQIKGPENTFVLRKSTEHFLLMIKVKIQYFHQREGELFH